MIDYFSFHLNSLFIVIIQFSYVIIISACQPYTYNITNGTGVLGLTQQPGTNFTETSCRDLCIATLTPQPCYNFDYNSQDKTCFFGFTSNTGSRVTNPPVNHWDIVRNPSCTTLNGNLFHVFTSCLIHANILEQNLAFRYF